jgi:hypothetical protein
MAVTASANSQEIKGTAPRLLQAGDKVTFQWPGTQRKSCGVIGSVDIGVDGLPWVWVQPLDLSSAIVHLSVDGTRRDCKDLSAVHMPMHNKTASPAAGG